MKKTLSIVLMLAVVTVVGPTVADAGQSATAKTYKLSAAMSTKQVVTVKNKPWQAPAAVANAKGTFVGTFDDKTRKLTWRITYTGIGNPSIAIADIHVGPAGKFGGVIVRLCGPCKSGQKGAVTVKRFVTDLTTGNSWVTVITEKYPNGVIRGQIRAR